MPWNTPEWVNRPEKVGIGSHERAILRFLSFLGEAKVLRYGVDTAGFGLGRILKIQSPYKGILLLLSTGYHPTYQSYARPAYAYVLA